MRKNATKIAALALSLALTVTSVNVPTNASAATKKAKLNKTKATLYVGGPSSKKSTTLKVTVNGKKKTATFTSSKKAVATVNKKTGKVTAKKAGKTVITAKVGKKSYKCTVTVKKFVKVTSVSVSPKSVSLNVGATKTVKATVKPSSATTKKVSYTSSNKSVATVTSAGKITAKAAGKATITVKATDGSNKKATVAVTVKDTATEVPTTAPSAEPSAEPSTEPTAEPSAEPTAAPATLGNITELTAASASKLVATFDAEVPADATIEVTKGNSKIDGKATREGKTVTFDATAKLTAGTYTLTATLGEAKVSKEVEVKDEYVAEIKILSKEALTSADNKKAYISYDVLNQYGESIRTSQTVNWTVSSSDATTVNKASGVITIENANGYTYGSDIYITGVHVKSGTALNTSIKIGMARAVNTVKFAGFLDLKNKKTILDKLPADFAKDKYVLLFQAFDQNDNPFEVSEITLSDPDADGNQSYKDLTFIADAPLLVKNTFYAAGVQTVDDAEYASIAVQPGQYVDRGGEVNVTVVSNKTGQKSTMNFVVGETAMLQSLALDTPSTVVADGDQGVKIPYTAKDTKGNTVTNYETIVRSTNALTLSSSEGELVVKEENDGTAGIYWSDSASATNWATSSAKDNINRNISLATIVVGGESNNMILEVSDTRRPTAIKSVVMGWNGNTVVAGTPITQSFKDHYTYLDQYGSTMTGEVAVKFFQNAFDGYQYGIKRNVVGTSNAFGMTDTIYAKAEFTKGDTTDANPADGTLKEGKTENVKYSIARIEASKATSKNVDDWDDISKVVSANFTDVPISEISNFAIQSISKQQIVTKNSDNANGVEIKDFSETVSDAAFAGTPEFKVVGTYEGTTVTIPRTYLTDSSWSNAQYYSVTGGAVELSSNVWDSKLASINSDALTWGDLYDENTAKATRKDATLTLKLLINNKEKAADCSVIKTTFVVSDAKAVASSIAFDAKPANATKTDLTGYTVKVKDQYGNEMAGQDVEYVISDLKESTDALTHIANSLAVNKNGSSTPVVTGAEIGDSFKITATVAGTNVSTDATITVGADTLAKVSSTEANSTDKTFRTAKLGYDR